MAFRYVNFGKNALQFGIKSAGFTYRNVALNRCKQGKYYWYYTNGYVFAHIRGRKLVTKCNKDEEIIRLIIDVLEDKLLISKNDKKKEYVVGVNIDLYNNKYNMAVSGSVKDGR